MEYLHPALGLMAISRARLQVGVLRQRARVRWGLRFAKSEASPPSFLESADRPAGKFQGTGAPRWTQRGRHKDQRHFLTKHQLGRTQAALSPEEPKMEIQRMSQQGGKTVSRETSGAKGWETERRPRPLVAQSGEKRHGTKTFFFFQTPTVCNVVQLR